MSRKLRLMRLIGLLSPSAVNRQGILRTGPLTSLLWVGGQLLVKGVGFYCLFSNAANKSSLTLGQVKTLRSWLRTSKAPVFWEFTVLPGVKRKPQASCTTRGPRIRCIEHTGGLL